ncbi:transmembrane emp24 domain-containing protein 7-like [Liolophura sinensis]|uniref:transmembrane emp24 domain-containing protein 7-like n=1 Tax=Liolophura sinensis TaxID=3198878 RepID=UPI0031581BA4
MWNTLKTVLRLLLLQCFLSVVQSHGTSLTFELPDNERFCLSETFDESKSYVFQYKVIRGGQNDVDMTLVSPNGKILYKELKKVQDKFRFDSSHGQFQFCFSNEFSTISHKVIFFDLRTEEMDNLAVEAGNKKPYVDTASENSMNQIHSSMSQVVDFQRQYRLREAMGRFKAEILNGRVMWWSLFQTLVIFIAGAGQVFLLKKCFTQSSSTLLPTAEVIHANQTA